MIGFRFYDLTYNNVLVDSRHREPDVGRLAQG